MRTRRLPLICAMTLVACTPPGVARAQGIPFIPVGPQPSAVPLNTEGWKSVVAEHGAPMHVKQTKLVEDIVAEISRAVGTIAPKGGYRATLLDTSVMNAFAIPDGNTFVTRQLLATMNDEDELIGVMGHEVGHVIGGHSNFRMSAGSAKARGDRLLGVFLPGIAEGAQLGGTLLMRGFSRSQEHSSDVAGVKVLADLGRDPLGMGRGLAILAAHSELRDKMFGAVPPGALDYWLSTHPLDSERIGLVQFAARMAPRAKAGPRRSREAFIRELDGLLYDDGPEHGIVDGARFRHPGMKFGLDAHPSFRLLNNPDVLIVRGSGGSFGTLKTARGSGDPLERFRTIWTKSFEKELALPTPVATQIGGMPGATGHTDVATDDGFVRFSMWVYAWSESESFIYVSRDPKAAQASQHAATAQSFRRLTEAEVAAVKVRRITVVDIGAADTVASLSAQMAYADFREERFRLINGLFDGRPLPKSGPIKLVTWSAK